jgi:hypothetical protein
MAGGTACFVTTGRNPGYEARASWASVRNTIEKAQSRQITVE